MAEVPDHLVPTDGLTSSQITYAGLDAIPGRSGAIHRFNIITEDGDYVGTLRIETEPTDKGTIDSMVADAYRQLTNMLRQWLYVADLQRGDHEK